MGTIKVGDSVAMWCSSHRSQKWEEAWRAVVLAITLLEWSKKKKKFQAPLVCVGRTLERKLLTLNLSNKCCCTIGFLVPGFLGSWGCCVFVLTLFQIPGLPMTCWWPNRKSKRFRPSVNSMKMNMLARKIFRKTKPVDQRRLKFEKKY